MTVTDVYYDPWDYTIDADPYPVWRRLRDEAPVYYNEQHDFYALSRYDDVLNGLVDTDTFKSGHGIVLEMITPEPYENIPMMIMKDPPEHTRLRKLVARAFTPRAISDLELLNVSDRHVFCSFSSGRQRSYSSSVGPAGPGGSCDR